MIAYSSKSRTRSGNYAFSYRILGQRASMQNIIKVQKYLDVTTITFRVQTRFSKRNELRFRVGLSISLWEQKTFPDQTKGKKNQAQDFFKRKDFLFEVFVYPAEAPRLIPCYFSNTIGTGRCQLFRICASKFLDFPILQGIPNFPIKLSHQFWKIDTFKVDDPANLKHRIW